MADELAKTIQDALAVDRVAVRVPQFCASDPELWFSMVEGSFASAGVTTDKTKFGYITGALDPRYALEVRDIIVNPPAVNAYETLKSELIKRLSDSQEKKTRQLLEHQELGDRKPSQFLRHLRGLAGSAVPDSMLRALWLGRLPGNVQAILASQKESSLDKVAELADAICESISPRAFIAETTPSPSVIDVLVTQLQQLSSSLRGEMASMRQEITELRSNSRDHNRSSSRSRVRSQSRTKSRDRGTDGKCWYHWRFGAEAHKCSQPCSYGSGNAAGSR